MRSGKAGGVKLIVGLGNPGPRYRDTRHNVGFRVLDRLAERFRASFSQEKYGGLLARATCDVQPVLFLKPLTFMNLSGDCVARALRYTGVDLGELLVVSDDVNLPIGKLRLRAKGSAGGHKGLVSIIEHLGTTDFPRLRMGVGENRTNGNLADHVLGSFTPEERSEVEPMVERAAEAVLRFISDGIEAAMTQFN